MDGEAASKPVPELQPGSPDDRTSGLFELCISCPRIVGELYRRIRLEFVIEVSSQSTLMTAASLTPAAASPILCRLAAAFTETTLADHSLWNCDAVRAWHLHTVDAQDASTAG
jgi:hypothetical protein